MYIILSSGVKSDCKFFRIDTNIFPKLVLYNLRYDKYLVIYTSTTSKHLKHSEFGYKWYLIALDNTKSVCGEVGYKIHYDETKR